jgi:hypothetical protein
MHIDYWWENKKERTIRKTKTWVDNIKVYPGEIGWVDMDWIGGSGWGPAEGSCEHSNEPSGLENAGKFLSSSTTGGLLRWAQFHGAS